MYLSSYVRFLNLVNKFNQNAKTRFMATMEKKKKKVGINKINFWIDGGSTGK